MYLLTISLLLILSLKTIADPLYGSNGANGSKGNFETLATLTDSELEEIDEMLNGYAQDSFAKDSYVCLASFRSEKRAVSMSTELSISGYEVIVRSAWVNGAEYHRVLVGPVPAENDFQIEFMRWLSDMGYQGVWLVKQVKAVSSEIFFDSGDELLVMKKPIRSTNQSQENRTVRQPYLGEDSEYNLARLRETTE